MSSKTVLVSLAAAALLAPAVGRAADAASDSKPGARATSLVKDAGAVPSFAGDWKLDRAKSTFPQRPAGGMRGGGGMRGEGGMRGGGERMRGGRGGDRDRRGGFMRSYVKIEQVDGLLTVADSSGTAIEEIVYEDPAPPSRGIRRLGGEWNGKSLVALGDAPNGGSVTETYTLQEGGQTLEVRTKILPPDDRPAMDFVRIYRRVKAAP